VVAGWILGLLGAVGLIAACVVPGKEPAKGTLAVQPADSEPAVDPNCPVEVWRGVPEEDLVEPMASAENPVVLVAQGRPAAGASEALAEAAAVVVPKVVDVVSQAAPEAAEAAPEGVSVVQHVAWGTPVGTSAGALTEADNAESRARHLSQPTPWTHGPIVRFKTLENPAADRAASLAARARLRAFEGAPPTMPHSDSYSAGTKTCLDCHLNGSTIGERVAHPLPHPVLINCQQCHVEETSRLYDELITPGSTLSNAVGNTFDGQFFERAGQTSIAGAPPVIPHGTFMRTQCLSCHGEFGYPGLQTPHPDRQNCLQCHLVVAPR